MACYNRMERTFLQGLLWMYLLGFGFMALSLEPGFLDFDNLPDTNFTCVGKVIGGYYADLETNCQMFHVCTIGQSDEPMDIRFLCLNGTVFDQETRVCERIDEVDCTKSEQFYSLNLELYGNSQPSNIEENPETEQPLIIKSTPVATTTPTEALPRSTSHPAYYTTARQQHQQQHLPSHHFPVVDSNTSPDIRFNPEEINISLNPGAPPDIRTNQNRPVSYYSDKKVIGVVEEAKAGGAGTKVGGSSTKVGGASTKAGGTSDVDRESYEDEDFKGYDRVTPREVNFGFKLGERGQDEEGEEEEEEEYGTEETHRNSFNFQAQFQPRQQYEAPSQKLSPHQFQSSTYHGDFSFPSPTTARISSFQHHMPQQSTHPTTNASRNYHDSPSHGSQGRSQFDVGSPPHRIQLPLPPSLPTLTFSTPAPFSLQRRIEQKRNTKDHLPPPRIVISASASVSDASGRRLNYSLGTIDTSPLLKHPPTTYDEYKDEDVILDPFYIDVLKLKPAKRRKRQVAEGNFSHYDIIKNDEDAVRVLKFLFDWYKNEKTNPSRLTTPLTSQGITAINDELSPEEAIGSSDEVKAIDLKLNSRDLLDKRSKYSMVDTSGSTTGREQVRKVKDFQKYVSFKDDDGDEIFKHEEDYINDNYEPAAYNHKYGDHSEDYGYNEGKDSREEFIHHFVGLDEQAKNFSVPDDYVDDNIEPIYYRDHSGKEWNQLGGSSYLETTTDHPQSATTTVETPDIVDFREYSTTEVSMSIETSGSSGRLITTTARIRNNRRRGRRKYQSESNKTVHLEKLVEKPYRPKDDYDNLRIVQIHTSSPKIETRTISENTEAYSKVHSEEEPLARTTGTSATEVLTSVSTVASTESTVAHSVSPNEPVATKTPSTEIPTFDSTVVSTEPTAALSETHVTPAESSVAFTTPLPVTHKVILGAAVPLDAPDGNTIVTTPSTTTTESSRSRGVKRGRSKNKYREETNQKKPQRAMKPPKPPENEEAQSENKAAEELLTYGLVDVETTTRSKLAKSRRGRMKFISSMYQKPLEDSSTPIVENSANSPSTIEATVKQANVLAIRSSTSSESLYQLIDSEPNESFPQATSTTIMEDNTHPYSKHLEEVYATAFVPTTESIYTSRKKQLKENLLNSEFATTESSLELNTRRGTDSTEYYTQSTEDVLGNSWATEEAASSTVTDAFTQITEGNVLVAETTTINGDHVFFQGMNLVSIVVEESVGNQVDHEISTETLPSTLYDETTAKRTHLDTTEAIPKVTSESSSKKEEMTATTAPSVTSTQPTVAQVDLLNLPDPSIAITEPLVPTTEPTVATTEPLVVTIEPLIVITESAVHTTEPPVVTDESSDYSQIPTTFPQTTISAEDTTTEQPTTTKRPQRRRSGRPTRRKPSSYDSGRHRFLPEHFSRRGKVSDYERLSTDFPVRKSVGPTQAERTLVTTPFSRMAVTVRKHFFFNCFGKVVDQFYPDSRDCRLFHYCTRGYHENQLLDLKFVCDFDTFFDDEKLICTKMKPKRCL